MVNYDTAVLSSTFAALADPTRRWILEQLAGSECTVSELAGPLDMSLPAVSKHLKILERAGLLVRRRRGRAHHMRVEPGPLRDAAAWIEWHRQFWQDSFDGLEAYLERTKESSQSDVPTERGVDNNNVDNNSD